MPSIAVGLVVATLAVAILALISERRARRAAQTAQARFLATMEATGFGVLMVELSGGIVYGNNAAADILGYPVHTLMKQNVYSLLPGGALDAPSASPLRRALGDQRAYVGRDHFVDIRGNLVPVAVSTATVANRSNDEGIALVFRDRSTEVADERQRHDALSMISHELRSPLTSVVGFSNRLERSVQTGRLEVDEAHAEEIMLLAQEARRMRDIVNIVLDVANLERQREFVSEPVLLRQVIDEEAGRLSREREGATFRRTGQDDAAIESDERYVRRIVQNLMENALKYAGTAAPVDVVVEEERNGYAVRVRDQGPGIQPADRERVFERFYRASGGTSGGGGLGLGLFLSRRLSQRLGGTLTVQSEPGQGAEFTLWLPAEAPLEVPAEQGDEPGRLIW